MRVIISFCILFIAIQAGLGQGHWQSVILAGQNWKYLPAVSEPPADWMMPGFYDGAWPEGPGGIGYADGDDATTIDRVNSLYLRKTFDLQDDTLINSLLLDIDYDDAFVAFLNGTEIARSFNITAAEPAFNSVLTTDREALMYQGGDPERFVVDTALLVQGENFLAVHILNNGIASSDLSSLAWLHGEINSTEQIYASTPGWFRAPYRFTESRLPLVRIFTGGRPIADDPRIVARMGIIHNGPGQINRFTDPYTDYDGRITIEIRGQSSQMFPKKAYAFETQDSLGENLDVPLLGMPEENDWILYAPYSDKSMLRNAVTFGLARKLDYYASRTVYCELFIDDLYQGVYLMMEKIKADDNRVDIVRMDTSDNSGDALTGGYIFVNDKTDKFNSAYIEGVTGFTSSPDPSYPNAKDVIYQYYQPGPYELTAAQKEYITGAIREAEAVLISQGFSDPDTGYNRNFNTGSFVDFMLISEISKEVDKYRYSSYMYKERDSRGGEIFAGPAWDFNLGYGNVDYWPEGLNTAGWLFDDLQPYEWSIVFFWARLMDDPWFRSLATTRWTHLRQGAFSSENIAQMIDSLTGVLDGAWQRNYERWPILGTYVWPNYDWEWNSYGDEVDYFSDWLFARLEWMDANFNDRILEPSAALIPLGHDGYRYHYRVALEDDQFDNARLNRWDFELQSDNPDLYIEQVQYEHAAAARVTVRGANEADIEGAAFSLVVSDGILNGFSPLETRTMQVGSDETIHDGSPDIQVYASSGQLFIRTDKPEALPVSAEVFNTLGQLAASYPLQRSAVNVITAGLPSDIYYVRLVMKGGITMRKVFIAGW